MSLYDGSKEVENGESCIYFAAWSSANEIVPTPLCVPCVGIMCRDLAAALNSKVTVYSCVNKHLERQLVLASRYRPLITPTPFPRN